MMNNNFGNLRSTTGPFIATQSVNAFMQRVFMIMTAGLVITGLSAYTFADYLTSNPAAIAYIFGSPLRWVLFLAPLAFVMVLSFGINRLSYLQATCIFASYAIVTGLSLSTIFLVYTSASIASTFMIAGGTFGAMAFLGMTTKMDLTKLGSYLIMALIGLVIASVVNVFLQSSTFHYITSFLGVVIFTGLTAYDTQKLMAISEAADYDSELSKKASLMGALTLYLDFINLFLYLLQFMGSRKD